MEEEEKVEEDLRKRIICVLRARVFVCALVCAYSPDHGPPMSVNPGRGQSERERETDRQKDREGQREKERNIETKRKKERD